MDSNNFMGFLALHSHPIVENLAEMRNISTKTALDLFYNSNLYRLYEHEHTKLWHFSNLTLTGMLDREITAGYIEFPVEG